MTNQGTTNDLLIEFLSEELPPINLEKTFGSTFANLLVEEIKAFKSDDSTIKYFVTPRRFGLIASNIKNTESAQTITKKGPAINTSLENGVPTKALEGFMKSCGVTNHHQLEQRLDGYFYFNVNKEGQSLESILPNAIRNTLKKLPIAKNMHWADHEYTFVRPVHNLIIMYGDKTICQNEEILGLKPVNSTLGHRIMSEGKITITNSNTYIEQLKAEGSVIAEFATRRELIKNDLTQQAKSLNLKLIETDLDELLNEVTALVEYPVVLQGEFAKSFLNTPQECLILSMAKNQKYFALLDNNGHLVNKFLFVANIASKDPSVIVHGNEKVLSARLADAEFFFNTDKKHSLEFFLKKLHDVVYHNKLGSQANRLDRLQKIAIEINKKLNLDPSHVKTAVSWLKADLMTEMVGEFPELQGVMGKYYAINNNVAIEIANSIEKHYYPRFSGDVIPDTPLSVLMSLTDKLELLVGIWGIGLIPSGEKDPFALRRAALGIIRILLANNFDLVNLLEISVDQFNEISTFNHKLDEKTNKSQVLTEVYAFILQRLSNYLISELNFKNNIVQAVLNSATFAINSSQSKSLSSITTRLSILTKFATDDKNQEFFQANKRIDNILRKNSKSIQEVLSFSDISKYLVDVSEKDLLDFVKNFDVTKINDAALDEYFKTLEKCSEILARFFDNVMVMADDINLRNARLSLLTTLQTKVNYLCNMSELAN